MDPIRRLNSLRLIDALRNSVNSVPDPISPTSVPGPICYLCHQPFISREQPQTRGLLCPSCSTRNTPKQEDPF